MKEFKCQKCGYNYVEEVLVNATVVSEIIGFEDGIPLYGDTCTESGDVSHYQCASCGWLVPCQPDDEGLIKWIEENGEEE